MNVLSFLVFWTLPLLQAGEQSQPIPRADALRVGIHASPVVGLLSREIPRPGDPGLGNLAENSEGDEDSLEDLTPAIGPLSSRSRRDLRRGDRSSLARPWHDLPRSPSRTLPLRC